MDYEIPFDLGVQEPQGNFTEQALRLQPPYRGGYGRRLGESAIKLAKMLLLFPKSPEAKGLHCLALLIPNLDGLAHRLAVAVGITLRSKKPNAAFSMRLMGEVESSMIRIAF